MMNLENILLSERNQTPKATHCMIPLTCNLQNGQVQRNRKQISGCQGVGEMESDCLMGAEFPFGVREMFWN